MQSIKTDNVTSAAVSAARTRRTVIALLAALLGVLGAYAGFRRYAARPSATLNREEARSVAMRKYHEGVENARAGNAAAATNLWQTAVALDPRLSAAHFALAQQQAARGDVDGSIQRLRSLQSIDPSAPHVDCTLATLYFQSGRVLKAFDVAQEAARKEPSCAQAQSMLGMARASLGDQPGAISALKAAHAAAPEEERITLTLAQVLAQSGNEEEARALAGPLAEKKDASLQALYLMGWLTAEYGPGKKGDRAALGQAGGYLTRVLKSEPSHVAAAAELGATYARLGDDRVAKPLLETAINNGAGSPELFTTLAGVYARTGAAGADVLKKRAAAMTEARAAIRKARARWLAARDDAHNALLLARLEATAGNWGDAVDLSQSVLRQSPNDAEALQVLNALMARPPKRRQMTSAPTNAGQ